MPLIQKVEVPPEELTKNRIGRPRTRAPHCTRCKHPTREVRSRNICRPCIRKLEAMGMLEDFPAAHFVRRDELLDTWKLMVEQGNASVTALAEKLGSSVDAVTAALWRARKDGDPRALYQSKGYRKSAESHKRRLREKGQ